MALSTGARIGPYEVLDLIGKGGMGEVYRAQDRRLGRTVALKIIGRAIGTSGDLQRFELEARATSAISHPNIVALYDVGEYEGTAYLVTELLTGETLRARLSRGAIPPGKAVEYARQIAAGLSAAHDRSIVHRDLKPENIFVTSDGHVKILDFGVAKVKPMSGADGPTGVRASGLTAEGTIVGTVDYMSPEQVRGEELDHRSDLFSFGAVLFEMLTARPAFRQGTSIDTLHAILNREPAQFEDAIAAVPAPVAFVVRQCLEKNSRERFQSARDLELHLSAIASGRFSSQTTPVTVSRTPRWLWPAAIAALIGLAAAAAFVVGRRTVAVADPDYHQLTFRRGFVAAARFTGDGHTVVYSAAWDGMPLDLFTTRLEAPESRPLDVKSAALLAISSAGEMAVLTNRQPLFNLLGLGTLARMPIVGGTPREVLNDVVQADWSPDGTAMAVVRFSDGKFRLEYPIGKPLYQNTGGIADIRVSRDGRSVAFIDHPVYSDDRGDIAVIGADGRKRIVSGGWASATGLAWAPQGDEVWFTASAAGPNTSLWASRGTSGARQLIKSLGRMTLLDVAANGQALISAGRFRLVMSYRDDLHGSDRMLSWFDASAATDISPDGGTVVFDEEGERTRSEAGYSIYLRKSDGSPAIRLGEGYGGSLSPNRQWVAGLTVTQPQTMTLLPTGAGQTVALPRGLVTTYDAVVWMPDGNSVFFSGQEAGKPSRLFIQGIHDALPRPVSPEGYSFPIFTAPLSADGRTAIATDGHGQLVKVSLASGTVQSLTGAQSGDIPMRWAADGRSVFVLRRHDTPATIWRVSVDGGHREFVLSLTPTDRAGYSGIAAAQITPDGQRLAFSFGQQMMDLYLVQGVR